MVGLDRIEFTGPKPNLVKSNYDPKSTTRYDLLDRKQGLQVHHPLETLGGLRGGNSRGLSFLNESCPRPHHSCFAEVSPVR